MNGTRIDRKPKGIGLSRERYLGIAFSSFSHDPGSGLAKVFAGRFLLRYLCWMAFQFAFQFISLPLCFIDSCTLRCHVHSLPQPRLPG